MPRIKTYFGIFMLCCLLMAGCHKKNDGPDFKVSGTQKAGLITNFSLTVVSRSEQWDFGDGGTAWVSNSYTNHIAHTYDHSGDFTVTVKIDNTTTVSKKITIQPNYTIVCSGSPVPGDTIRFGFPAVPPVGNTYSWDFGDGGSSADSTPFHIYGAPGNYHVSVFVNSATNSSSVLHIYRDPVYTSAIAGTRTYKGYSWTSVKAGDTTILDDKSITINYVNKATLAIGYIQYTFNEQYSNDNELYFTTGESRDLDRIYYNHSKDSISINMTDLYGSGAADVIYRYYHNP